ncbi:hypothetical protein ACMFMG_004218 [Clarireedia jacksonii]
MEPVNLNPQSCAQCKRMIICIDVFSWGIRWLPYRHVSYAASNGCLLFQYLLGNIPPTYNIEEVSLDLCARVDNTMINTQHITTLHFVWRTEGEGRWISQIGKFEFFTYRDSATEKDIGTGPINRSPGSIQSFQPIRYWLEDCLKNHADCKSYYDARFLPKRLIELRRKITEDDQGGEWELRLVQAIKYEPYAALGYCWGGNQQLKTTRETL